MKCLVIRFTSRVIGRTSLVPLHVVVIAVPVPNRYEPLALLLSIGFRNRPRRDQSFGTDANGSCLPSTCYGYW